LIHFYKRAKMNSRIYFFRSLDGLCPDIELMRDEPLILGRGPLTRVKDTKVSRQQLRATWDDRGIFLRQTGDNPAYVNTRPLKKGEKVEFGENQVVYLVSNKFPFKLILKTDFIAAPPTDNTRVIEQAGGVKRDSNGATKTKTEDKPSPVSQSKPRVDYNHWSHGLLASMKDPNLKVLEKPDHVVIKDKFPKARHHYLVLPVERIQNLASLQAKHLPLLKDMVETGRTLVSKHPDSQFRLGFHAVPSMAQVHLHVISQDFDSPCLKNKKHWNSFTTDYFVNPEHVIDKLSTKGKYTPVDSKQAKDWLNLDLQCHKCHNKPKNMPDLKKHILTHLL